ncbi:MAG: hypothetical protein Kow0065_20260 [Methylomicrobium sp.]
MNKTADQGTVASSVPVLSRITTVYIPTEDRVRLSGQVAPGRVVVVWLSLRLLNRMVPMLTEWLEKQDADLPRADLLQSVKQERARDQLLERARQDGELPVPAEQPESDWLARSVDVQQRSDRMQLIFKDQPSPPQRLAALPLQPLQLRQWLNILLTAYAQAQWPLDVWPEWIREQVGVHKPRLASYLH